MVAYGHNRSLFRHKSVAENSHAPVHPLRRNSLARQTPVTIININSMRQAGRPAKYQNKCAATASSAHYRDSTTTNAAAAAANADGPARIAFLCVDRAAPAAQALAA